VILTNSRGKNTREKMVGPSTTRDIKQQLDNLEWNKQTEFDRINDNTDCGNAKQAVAGALALSNGRSNADDEELKEISVRSEKPIPSKAQPGRGNGKSTVSVARATANSRNNITYGPRAHFFCYFLCILSRFIKGILFLSRLCTPQNGPFMFLSYSRPMFSPVIAVYYICVSFISFSLWPFRFPTSN